MGAYGATFKQRKVSRVPIIQSPDNKFLGYGIQQLLCNISLCLCRDYSGSMPIST